MTPRQGRLVVRRSLQLAIKQDSSTHQSARTRIPPDDQMPKRSKSLPTPKSAKKQRRTQSCSSPSPPDAGHAHATQRLQQQSTQQVDAQKPCVHRLQLGATPRPSAARRSQTLSGRRRAAAACSTRRHLPAPRATTSERFALPTRRLVMKQRGLPGGFWFAGALLGRIAPVA